jgi:AcrR family transcriptional regulator
MTKRLPIGRPSRRTQAQRSAETRERVLQAVVDCIVDEGLQATTAARIVERSGVTWGAIAHQFGDKDSLLLAVLERTFQNQARRFAAHEIRALSARNRVDLLVDETWSRMNDPSLQVFLEIVLGRRAGDTDELRSRREEMVVGATQKLWNEMFRDLGVDAKTIDTVRKLTLATLLGMALQGMMGPRRPRFARELEILKRSVLRELGLADGE